MIAKKIKKEDKKYFDIDDFVIEDITNVLDGDEKD